MQDPDVVALSRIVEYVLRGERKDDEKMLSIRNFTISQKDALFKELAEKQEARYKKQRVKMPRLIDDARRKLLMKILLQESYLNLHVVLKTST